MIHPWIAWIALFMAVGAAIYFADWKAARRDEQDDDDWFSSGGW